MKNKETLEEAAERYSKRSSASVFQEAHKKDFIEGAKYQAERMYSEAIEFGKWLDKNMQQREYYPMSAMIMEELFEQFKKK